LSSPFVFQASARNRQAGCVDTSADYKAILYDHPRPLTKRCATFDQPPKFLNYVIWGESDD